MASAGGEEDLVAERRPPRSRPLERAVAWLVVGAAAASLRAETGERPHLDAHPVTEPILVDGLLDEPAWQSAPVASGFFQREPWEGQPATEPTEFRVAYTETTLYIAVRSWQSGPLVAKEMERDAALYRDDSIVVLLDTFNDRRNAYAFETNPNGVSSDVLITDEREVNRQWDGVWTVACRRDEQGWTAEFAIPFSTLRFDPGSETWGLNVRRMIRHQDEEVNWAFVGRDVGSARDPEQYAIYRVSRAGELRGLRGLKRSRRVDIKPFVVGSLDERPQAAGDSESEGVDETEDDTEVGLDVKWGLGKALALDLTYNTDFAEVEVDQQQVNLTRFSLFFPEKREFFLENAGIFEFGLPNRDTLMPALMKLFFSRRIGLDGGSEVPILGGARLTGRLGGWNLGVLGVGTEDTVFDGGSSIGDTRFGVVRVKRNLGRRSGLGLLFTDRDETGVAENRVFGLDLDWKPTRKIDAAAFLARTDDPSLAGDDTSWGYAFGYSSSALRASFEHSLTPQGFDPRVGFLLRRDFERVNPRLQYRPRIDRWGIRSLFFEAYLDYFARASTDQLETRQVSLSPVGFRSVHEDGWSLNWISDTEQLFEPFAIRPGIVIAPGLYRFDGWQLGGRTNDGRRAAWRGRITVGDFYDGERSSANISMWLRSRATSAPRRSGTTTTSSCRRATSPPR